MIAASNERATHELRWLDVGGIRPRLQQKFVLTVKSSDPKIATAEEVVWRDVPTVPKEKA